MNKIKIAIIGATGFTGLDLTHYLAKHPRIKIVKLCATKNLGKNIFFFDKRIKQSGSNVAGIRSAGGNRP